MKLIIKSSYLSVMIKIKISIGRASRSADVDIDLASIKFDKKISRKHCVIYHINSNLFYIMNKSKTPIFVDGNQVLVGNKQRLNDKSLIEVSLP